MWAFDARGRPLWRYRTPFPLYNVVTGRTADKRVFVAAGGIGHTIHLLSSTGKLLATHGLAVLVHRLAAADFDGDGASELLAVDARNVIELLKVGPAGLRRLWRKDLRVPESYRNWENPRGAFFAFSAAAADLDGDRLPEMIFGDTYFNKHAVLAARASGEPLWITPPLPEGMGNWRRVAAFDRWYEFYSTAWVTAAEAAPAQPHQLAAARQEIERIGDHVGVVGRGHRQALAEERISEGHARTLLSLSTPQAQSAVLQSILSKELNVRQTELLVRKLMGEKPRTSQKHERPPEVAHIEDRLRSRLGTKVKVNQYRKGGTVVIHYFSPEELESILAILLGQ